VRVRRATLAVIGYELVLDTTKTPKSRWHFRRADG
jgi:hypothetical protein